jgi:acyl-CoA thioesterase-1
MKQNLSRMVDLCLDANAVPILFGMRIPPNYGRRYTDAFAKVYVQLSMEKRITLIPFQLEELAITEGMIQQDGLHPTEKAQPIIKDVVKVNISPLLYEKQVSDRLNS